MDARYRRAGFLTRLSEGYLERLECDDDTRQRFRDGLTKFESCCIGTDFEECLYVFDFDVHESHHFFLKRLYKHVRSVTLAETAEALRDTNSLSGIEKMLDVLVNGHKVQVEDAQLDPKTGVTHIHFDVKPPVDEVKVTRGGSGTE